MTAPRSDHSAGPASSGAPGERRPAGPAFLHLEDDPLDHKLVRAALEREGLGGDVTRAADGDEYRRLIAARCYDLILADFNLIGIDGRAALEIAQATCADVPFVVLSGAMGETAAVEILKAGATDVVLKDHLDRLGPAVRRALREAGERAARRHAEERLRGSEGRLRLMVESVRDYAIFSMDPGGVITSWNIGAERVFGHTEAQILGQPVDVLFTPEDRAGNVPAAERERAAETGSAADDRFHLRRDGTRFYANGVVNPVRDESGALRGFTKVAQDVTARKKIEVELRRARDAAEAASQAKDHFLAVLSHELRTPLTPVLTTAQLMERDVTLEPRARDAFALIRRNVELETRLIDDLLDLTRVSRGKMEFSFATVDVHEQVARVLAMCSDDARAKGIDLASALGATRRSIHADGARVQQVFWNLIKNAIKFTPAGGAIEIRTSDAPAGGIVIDVTDNGSGIDPALLPRLFQPFEQGGKDVTRLFGGLGLGLTICKAIVESHGGTIAVASDGLGHGTRVRVTVPTVESNVAADVSADLAKADAPMPAAGSRRILLVEDNPDTAGIMAMVLRMSGFEVRVADSVAAALKSAAAEPPDLVVSDIGLPDGSGLDLMRQLRARGPLRGIALSGYGQEEDLRRSRDAGFSEHLIKPVDIDALDRAVRRLAAGA